MMRAKVNGIKWPTAASNALEAYFVTAEEAEKVKETGVFERGLLLSCCDLTHR
jgi:hypothetical protein